jgi:hypothetical protein
MRIVPEKIDDSYYVDIIVNQEELRDLRNREMIEGIMILESQRYHVGIFLQGNWEYEEDESEE